MLVTFRTKAFGNIIMFGDVAVKLLEKMGHSGTVPSAIEPEDIPEALQRLRAALEIEASRTEPAESEEAEEHPEHRLISLKQRAMPLIELFEAAEKAHEPVTWYS